MEIWQGSSPHLLTGFVTPESGPTSSRKAGPPISSGFREDSAKSKNQSLHHERHPESGPQNPANPLLQGVSAKRTPDATIGIRKALAAPHACLGGLGEDHVDQGEPRRRQSSPIQTRSSVPVIPANESVSTPSRCRMVTNSFANGSSSTSGLLCQPASVSIPAPA